MEHILSIGLFVAGCSLAILGVASLWIPKALEWQSKTAGLTPLMKELWWTYSVYVWGSHVFFSVMCLSFPDWFLSQTPAATAMTIFIFLWWAIRLYLQFFGFDFGEIKGTPFNRVAKHLLSLLFLGLVVLFGGLICWNVGWLGEGWFQ